MTQAREENILIVDDSDSVITLLNAMLSRVGFSPMWVNGGPKLFELLQTTYRPNLILLDILMPEMDGLEVCRKLKSLSEYKDIPVIFITGNSEKNSISDSFNAGGADFIQKPLNPKEVVSRVNAQLNYIKAMSESKALSDKLQLEIQEKESIEKMLRESNEQSFKHGAQLLDINKNLQHEIIKRKFVEKELAKTNELLEKEKKKLDETNELLLSEQRVAKQVFDKVIDKGCLESNPNLEYYMSPMAIFNGDLIFAVEPDENTLQVVLGDFTGHGLPAAIGIIPFAKIFFGMAAKNHESELIISEINRELKEILPISLFCAAIFLEVNKKEKKCRLWAGCMPNALYLDKNLNIKKQYKSEHVPLGILEEKDFNSTFIDIEYEEGDSFLFYTDGVIESHNEEGEYFGMDRFCDLFPMEDDNMIETITLELSNFRSGLDQQDDLTLVRVKF